MFLRTNSPEKKSQSNASNLVGSDDSALKKETPPTWKPSKKTGGDAGTTDKGETSEAKKKKEKPFTPDHTSKDFKAKKAKKIKKSIEVAYKMATKAEKKVSKDDERYKTWMDNGKTDTDNTDARVAHVKDGFSKIVTHLKEEETHFKKYDLKDGEEDITYAYVMSNEVESNIYLGGQFWDAKTKGYDSKGGTIIHELSHKLHGTDDHVYGQKGAKKLAKDDPAKATTNADNYEYFAEKA